MKMKSPASFSAAPGKRRPASSAAEPPGGGRDRLARDILRILFVALFFVGLAILLKNPHIRENLFDIEVIRDRLQNDGTLGGRLGSWGLFILAGAALMAVGMPRVWVSAVAGAIYGAATGWLLAMISTTLGAILCYQLGRSLLGGVARRRLGKRATQWAARLRENGFWWTLYGRLLPISNATLLNLLCGACRVRLRAYVAATFLGFIPMNLIFAIMGSGGAKGNVRQILLGFALLLLTFMIQTFYTRRQKAQFEQER